MMLGKLTGLLSVKSIAKTPSGAKYNNGPAVVKVLNWSVILHFNILNSRILYFSREERRKMT